jgi:hypothetical protein
VRRLFLIPLLLLAACAPAPKPASPPKGASHPVVDKLFDRLGRVGVKTDATKPGEPIVGLTLAYPEVRDDDLQGLADIETLENVELFNSAVTDAGMKHLVAVSRLKALNLDRTAVTDAGLAELEKAAGLRDLSVLGTKATAAGIDHFRKARPDCALRWKE